MAFHPGAFDDVGGFSDPRADEAEERPPDLKEGQAVDELRTFFEQHPTQVYSCRQIEVRFENTYFHWITYRALRDLAGEGTITLEQQQLSTGTSANFVWHRSNRYPRRQLKTVRTLIERYSHEEFTQALGNTGELLVSDGLGRFGFVQRGRETREYNGRRWTQTQHNLDFLFERDGRVYGVEVKNTLGYISDEELGIKLNLCAHLGLAPLFIMRMAPRPFIQRINQRGGFALILRHQLYPLSHRSFAQEVASTLGLPVDAPRALYDGTIQRFVRWHEQQLGAGVPASGPTGREARSDRGSLHPLVKQMLQLPTPPDALNRLPRNRRPKR